MIKTYLVDDEQVIIDELLKIVDWKEADIRCAAMRTIRKQRSKR